MVLKAPVARAIFDNYKHDPQTAKDGLRKKPAVSFATVLAKAMKSIC